MSEAMDCDYLVIGAGTAGMAFTDALLAHSDATVTIVDRRHAPGGHWIDAYPFVRLHQPSSFYGVASVPLGTDAMDRSGLNEGFYELASADELLAYYAQVMRQHFLPTGRVRHVPCSDYLDGASGTHRFASRLTGETHEIRVRRKLVDTSYLEGSVPATSSAPFELADGVRCMPAGEVTRLEHGTERFAVIGGGKTALDTCVWLLSNGVRPQAIRWIKPRESWWLNRRFHQPNTLLPEFCAGVAMQMEAMAEARTVEGRLRTARGGRFPHQGGPLRRAGHDARRHPEREGTRPLATDRGRRAPGPRAKRGARPHRARRRVRTCPPGHGVPALRCLRPRASAAAPCLRAGPCHRATLLLGFRQLPVRVAGRGGGVGRRHRGKKPAVPAHPLLDVPTDYLSAYLALLRAERARAAYPAVAAWAKDTRLNPLAGMGRHREDPVVAQAVTAIKRFGAAASENVAKLLTA
jgi:hypothetical protein